MEVGCSDLGMRTSNTLVNPEGKSLPAMMSCTIDVTTCPVIVHILWKKARLEPIRIGHSIWPHLLDSTMNLFLLAMVL